MKPEDSLTCQATGIPNSRSYWKTFALTQHIVWYCGQHIISVVVNLMIQGRRQQRKSARSLKMFFLFSSRLCKLTLSICSRSYFYDSKFRKRKKILSGLDDVQNVKWVTTAVRRGHQNACVRDMAIIACVFCRNLHLTIWFLVFDK